MTITYYSANIIKGLSTDTKPTDVPANSVFIETDTRTAFDFDGSVWIPSSYEWTVEWITTLNNVTGNANSFIAIGGAAKLAEASTQYTTINDMILNRFKVVSSNNTKDGATILTFRKDGADVAGTTLTINAAATGEFDSGALNVLLPSGSKINLRHDSSASTTGGLHAQVWIHIHRIS